MKQNVKTKAMLNSDNLFQKCYTKKQLLFSKILTNSCQINSYILTIQVPTAGERQEASEPLKLCIFELLFKFKPTRSINFAHYFLMNSELIVIFKNNNY